MRFFCGIIQFLLALRANLVLTQYMGRCYPSVATPQEVLEGVQIITPSLYIRYTKEGKMPDLIWGGGH